MLTLNALQSVDGDTQVMKKLMYTLRNSFTHARVNVESSPSVLLYGQYVEYWDETTPLQRISAFQLLSMVGRLNQLYLTDLETHRPKQVLRKRDLFKLLEPANVANKLYRRRLMKYQT